MAVNGKFLAPCGLYCGVCAVYYATRDDNRKFKERLVGVYKGKLPGSANLSIDDVCCEGCLSDKHFGFCTECLIRDCTQSRGYAGCHECNDFPCQFIEDFPMPVGHRVIMRAIPYRRDGVPKSGFRMKKPATFALTAATSCSGAPSAATSARQR